MAQETKNIDERRQNFAALIICGHIYPMASFLLFGAAAVLIAFVNTTPMFLKNWLGMETRFVTGPAHNAQQLLMEALIFRVLSYAQHRSATFLISIKIRERQHNACKLYQQMKHHMKATSYGYLAGSS